MLQSKVFSFGSYRQVVVGWVLLYVHRNRRFIRDGSPGRPPRLSHSSRVINICNNSNSSSLLLDFRIELVFVFHRHLVWFIRNRLRLLLSAHVYTKSIIVNCESDVYQSVKHLMSGDSSVVWTPVSWSKGRGFESRQVRRENFLLQGQLSLLTRAVILPKKSGGWLQLNT